MDTDAAQISVIGHAELTPAQVAEFGAYAAACNSRTEQYIGYLGIEPDDVTAELRELEGDHVYAVARDGAGLRGLLCAEWDTDLRRTWLYGPWAETSELMRFDRARLGGLTPVTLPPLTERWHAQVADLHDRSFPNTYAPASVLLARDQPMYRTFVAADGDTLLGYVVLKLRPEFGEALIEYVAVTEAARGRGVGTRLVTAALFAAFADPRLAAMDLVTSNPAARRVYEKVGFTLLHDMRGFRITSL